MKKPAFVYFVKSPLEDIDIDLLYKPLCYRPGDGRPGLQAPPTLFLFLFFLLVLLLSDFRLPIGLNPSLWNFYMYINDNILHQAIMAEFWFRP